jgi:hypothetical protein
MNNIEQNLSEKLSSPIRSREEDEVVVEQPVYKPSNAECLREYEVSIRFFNRGCLVRVGCQEIAFENIEDARKELNEYLTNTYETKEKWRKILD